MLQINLIFLATALKASSGSFCGLLANLGTKFIKIILCVLNAFIADCFQIPLQIRLRTFAVIYLLRNHQLLMMPQILAARRCHSGHSELVLPTKVIVPHTTTHRRRCRQVIMRNCPTADLVQCRRMTSVIILHRAGASTGITQLHRR